jgi:hypothetical protein
VRSLYFEHNYMHIFFAVLAALIVFFYFRLVLGLLWALRYVFLALALIVAGLAWVNYSNDARWRTTDYRMDPALTREIERATVPGTR